MPLTRKDLKIGDKVRVVNGKIPISTYVLPNGAVGTVANIDRDDFIQVKWITTSTTDQMRQPSQWWDLSRFELDKSFIPGKEGLDRTVDYSAVLREMFGGK